MYIGIDLHKETCYATTLDKEGEIIDRREFKNLAKLLRADFLPQSYIPSKAIRENRELLRLRVQLGKDRTMIKNRIHALMAKNGVKHEFSDLFGVEGRNFLREIELPKSQRIGLDVLQRQLESIDKEIEHVQKQIAMIARGDEDVKLLMTIPGIDYYSAMIIKKLKKKKGTKIAVVATARKLLRVIYCMLSRKEKYKYERKALTEGKLKRLEKTAC